MLFKGKISSTLVGCQGAVCVESLAKWPPALITAMLVLGPGGNCSREYIDTELFWNDLKKMCDVKLNSTGLVTNLGGQWRREVIWGVRLI